MVDVHYEKCLFQIFDINNGRHLEIIKVKRMQRPVTEAIRTKVQPSKPKREITYMTNSQNTKRIYGQPSEQLFPKRWPFSDHFFENRTKMI